MKLLMLPVLLFGMLAGLLFHRPKWDDRTARDRYLRGEMSETEKRFRGYFPYHGGPFA